MKDLSGIIELAWSMYRNLCAACGCRSVNRDPSVDELTHYSRSKMNGPSGEELLFELLDGYNDGVVLITDTLHASATFLIHAFLKRALQAEDKVRRCRCKSAAFVCMATWVKPEQVLVSLSDCPIVHAACAPLPIHTTQVVLVALEHSIDKYRMCLRKLVRPHPLPNPLVLISLKRWCSSFIVRALGFNNTWTLDSLLLSRQRIWV